MRSRVRGFEGARLRERRVARNLTQSELATALGVSTRTMQGWEAGTARPDEPTIAAMAATLRCGVRDLVRLDDGETQLADLRVYTGLRQADAADRLGWHRATLRALERGERPPSAAQRASLADLYGVSADVLAAAAERTAVERRAAVRVITDPLA